MTSVLAIRYRANRQTFFFLLFRILEVTGIAVSGCERVVVKITADVLFIDIAKNLKDEGALIRLPVADSLSPGGCLDRDWGVSGRLH
jgi:hypothetical protein